MVLDGEVLSIDQIRRRIERGEENIDDPLQIDEWLFIDVNELSRSFNHSCEPNAGMRKRSELFALRDILPGEEITFDYSTTVGPNVTADMWTMKCNCGSEMCRKTIGNVLSVSENRLQAYSEAGALQDYIIAALKLPAAGSDQ